MWTFNLMGKDTHTEVAEMKMENEAVEMAGGTRYTLKSTIRLNVKSLCAHLRILFAGNERIIKAA